MQDVHGSAERASPSAIPDSSPWSCSETGSLATDRGEWNGHHSLRSCLLRTDERLTLATGDRLMATGIEARSVLRKLVDGVLELGKTEFSAEESAILLSVILHPEQNEAVAEEIALASRILNRNSGLHD